jgi:cytochrome c biogenesis protein CcmG/thiol:disulfide interchange protein DsbE
MSSRRVVYLIPVLGFLVVAAAFLWGLNPERNPREVPSVFIDRPVPDFTLPALEGTGVPGFSSADPRSGQVALVNVFASWCVPCRAEHPFLVRLAGEPAVPIYGINYKDKRTDAVAWLAELGNPYVAIGADESGRVAIDRGIYGVPKTFVIDPTGVIRYRQVGPLFPQLLEEDILPLIRSLRGEKA